jgi:putative flavoprotein involved in K+ transport
VHERGLVAGEPGLYFVGLNFIHAASSAQINGVGRDAAHVAKAIAARVRGSGAPAELHQPVATPAHS